MSNFVNLLPFAYRRSTLLRRWLLEWSLIWILCLLVLAGVWWLKQVRCRATSRAMKAAEARHLPLTKIVQQGEIARAELERLQAKGTLLGQLRNERSLLTMVGVVSRSGSQCDGRLIVRDLLYQAAEQPPKRPGRPHKGPQPTRQPPAAEEPVSRASLTLSGEALDNIAVARFVVALRDAGIFRRVELKSSVGKNSADSSLRSYQLNCEID